MKEVWIEAAECMRTLSHPHRLEMIHLLIEKERSVGELARTVGLLSHVASEHLMLLKAKGLLSSRREGRSVYYSVNEEALFSIMKCIRKRFFKE